MTANAIYSVKKSESIQEGTSDKKGKISQPQCCQGSRCLDCLCSLTRGGKGQRGAGRGRSKEEGRAEPLCHEDSIFLIGKKQLSKQTQQKNLILFTSE